MTDILENPVVEESLSEKKHAKITEINYRRNLESDYTERMKLLDRSFDYQRDRTHFWGDPELSLLYGTPLYEQASHEQKLALNHLYWATQYNQTAATEANTVLYNQVTTGVFEAVGGLDTLCQELNLETDQERDHIHAFHTVGYKTKKALLGQAGFTASIAGKKMTVKSQSSLFKFDWNSSPLAAFQDSALRFVTNKVFLREQAKYYSNYLQQFEEKGEGIPAQTTGLVGQLGPRPVLKLFTLNSGSSPFLACTFYVTRFMANMLLKNYEYRYSQTYRELERKGEFIPAPVAISHFHLLDESFHTTTSQLIAQELYKDFAKPSPYEQFVANLTIYQAQRVALSGLSAGLPGIFRNDDAFILSYYKLLQSPVFGMSSEEALEWLEKSLCQEHEGFHTNLKSHRKLHTDLQRLFADIDYLWAVNREMQVMGMGGSIEKTIHHNQKAFQRFKAELA
jgi:hypothetical protein